VTDRQTDTG